MRILPAQEAEAEEEGEAQRMADWDQGLANESYKAEIERAQAEQQRLDEEAAAWVNLSPPEALFPLLINHLHAKMNKQQVNLPQGRSPFQSSDNNHSSLMASQILHRAEKLLVRKASGSWKRHFLNFMRHVIGGGGRWPNMPHQKLRSRITCKLTRLGLRAEKEAERLAVLLEAAARPVSTKRPRETFIDDFEDSEAQESDGESPLVLL